MVNEFRHVTEWVRLTLIGMGNSNGSPWIKISVGSCMVYQKPITSSLLLLFGSFWHESQALSYQSWSVRRQGAGQITLCSHRGQLIQPWRPRGFCLKSSHNELSKNVVQNPGASLILRRLQPWESVARFSQEPSARRYQICNIGYDKQRAGDGNTHLDLPTFQLQWEAYGSLEL